MAQELITMTPKELSRYEVIKKLLSKKLNGTEASKQLCLSVRQVKRIKARVKQYGVKGIMHASREKLGNRRMPTEKIEKIERKVKSKYPDFGPTFAAEKLEEEHQLKISKEKLRCLMIGWGVWKPKPRKKNKEYRSWRQRKEQFGEMEQFDGSYHCWFEDRAGPCCLLASIDDATGRIMGLEFIDWEGVKPVFSFWKGYLGDYGKPVSVYLDRHSTYKQNQKSVFDDPQCLTQFQRAMEQDLNIKLIHARSPQAKGRAERLFETLQDRLVKELRLAAISARPEANRFVREVFIPKFNKKFSVLPQKNGNLHRTLTEFEKNNLDKIFSIYNTRTVNNDFTVRFQGKWYQLAPQQPVLVRKREKVQIEERISGELFIALRNKYLSYTILPARPKKIKEVKVPALSTARPTWKPSPDHPWKKPFILNPAERYQAPSLVESDV